MEYLFKALEAAIENAADQRQGTRPAAPPAPPRDKPAPPKRQQKAVPPPEPPSAFAVDLAPRRTDGGLVPLFEDGNSIVRALVAAEVLGPPVALRELSTWSLRPNEPSI